MPNLSFKNVLSHWYPHIETAAILYYCSYLNSVLICCMLDVYAVAIILFRILLFFIWIAWRGGSPHLVHRLHWYGFVIFFKNKDNFQWNWKKNYTHINLHHLAIRYVQNIFQCIFSSSVLKGKVMYILNQTLSFYKIWITSCIWYVSNSLELDKKNTWK